MVGVGYVSSPESSSLNRPLAYTTWGQTNWLRRAKKVNEWRDNRRYLAVVRDGQFRRREQRLLREARKEKQVDHQVKGDKANRVEIKKERFRERIESLRNLPRIRYSRELLRPCNDHDDELSPLFQALKARLDKYGQKNRNLSLEAPRSTPAIWYTSRRYCYDDAGDIIEQTRKKRISSDHPTVSRILKRLEILKDWASSTLVSYRYVNPAKPLRLFSASGIFFDNVLPPPSNGWVQEGLRIDDELESEEQPPIEGVQDPPKEETRLGKMYEAIRYRCINGKLVRLAENVRLLSNKTRSAIRHFGAKMRSKQSWRNTHIENVDRAVSRLMGSGGQAVQCLIQQRLLPISIQGRRYAYERLTGNIADDPAPMPSEIRDSNDIVRYYKALQEGDHLAGLEQRTSILARRRRTETLWIEAVRADDPARDRCVHFADFTGRPVAEVDAGGGGPSLYPENPIGLEAGEGSSSLPAKTLRRCQNINFDLGREDKDETEHDTSLPNVESCGPQSSRSTETNRRRHFTVYIPPPEVRNHGPCEDETDGSQAAHFSVESRLLELTEEDNLRKLELINRLSRVGSRVLLQKEFPHLLSPQKPKSGSLHVHQSPDIVQSPQNPEPEDVPKNRNHFEETGSAIPSTSQSSEQQEMFPDFQPLCSLPKSSVADRYDGILDPTIVPILGSVEQELAFRENLQRRITEDGIRRRATFVRAGISTGTKGRVTVNLDDNPDFSVGRPRNRFDTNDSGTNKGRSATLTRFADGGRQDQSDNNLVNKPTQINPLSNSRHPALSEQGVPDPSPRPGLLPLRLASQQSPATLKDHRSPSAPHHPQANQHQSRRIGLGLRIAVGNRVTTAVRDMLVPGQPGPEASRPEDSSKIAKDDQTEVQQKIAHFEGNYKPSFSPSVAGAFELWNPSPGEGDPDYQHRMYRPRYKTFPAKPATGKDSAKAPEERVGLGLIDHLPKEKSEEVVDEGTHLRQLTILETMRERDEVRLIELMEEGLLSSGSNGIAGALASESASESASASAGVEVLVGVANGNAATGAEAAVQVEASSGRQARTLFTRGTRLQPLCLASPSQLGFSLGETPMETTAGATVNPNANLIWNVLGLAPGPAGTAGTTPQPASTSFRGTEAETSGNNNDNDNSSSIYRQERNGHKNAHPVPNPSADRKENKDIRLGINAGKTPTETSTSASANAAPSLPIVTNVSQFSRSRARPPPLPVLPRPLPALPHPHPFAFRPLPPLPIRTSYQLPLVPDLPPAPQATPSDHRNSVASTGSNSSQRTITPDTSLFPSRPPPDILGKAYSSAISILSPAPASPTSFSTMENNRLTVRSPEISQIRSKAIEDARSMQAKVMEECKKTKKEPPPYVLEELIGKGSFGRVYKGKHVGSAAVVAVKIIDIDESDTINPRNADSYSEFLKEVNALKILSEKNAKNINLIIEALPVNQAMWMITELCGGGSVATLMKPTAPGGLSEKWIIPILREVAEAIVWVHEAGIIHRDIKCANVLITEEGNVQLCDFGVAGIVESKIDKRSTIIGTPHWMAPELFGASPSYGSEVDIWAFGSMVFEIATGLPPNVANGVSYDRLGSYLQNNTPRLEGGNYSNNLRNLVAYCLEEDPKARPTISQVQKHPYILNTSSSYPTATLKSLVGSFKVWESRGGSRKSLFMQYGAQGATPALPTQDEGWNFNGTEYFEGNVWGGYGVKDVLEAYGPAAAGFVDETTRPPAKVSRRRPPPEALSRLPTAPLEKIFDPNTMTTYEDNSRAHYGRHMSQSGPSDLPLRDDSTQISIRDTMIDLGGHDVETGISSFRDMDTIKAGRRGRDDDEDGYSSNTQDFSRPALSDPAETNDNRHTVDWKFPSMALPASADPELSRFPTSYEVPRPLVTPGSGGRPALMHHPTEPVGAFGGGLTLITQPPLERQSMRESLIDLDMSMPDPIPEYIPEYRRPSTANSDVGSATSEQVTSANPFELERHASLYQPVPVEAGREPSIYVSDDTALPPLLRDGNVLQELAEMSDFSASDAEGPNGRSRRDRNAPYEDSDDSYYVVNPGLSEPREGRNRIPQYDGSDDRDYIPMPPPPVPPAQEVPVPRLHSLPTMRFPDLPAHPSRAALTGDASLGEMRVEITRGLSALSSQMEVFKEVYEKTKMVQRNSSNRRTDRYEAGTM